MSLVLEKKPELYTAALMCSSKWDGAYEPVVEAKTPVYFVIGENDEYYGSSPFKEAYQHGGGYLFCRDKEIMEWLFNH